MAGVTPRAANAESCAIVALRMPGRPANEVRTRLALDRLAALKPFFRLNLFAWGRRSVASQQRLLRLAPCTHKHTHGCVVFLTLWSS